ncbi:transposable element Tc1 transposase [Trichonephila clavipes]|nr:transposable element Tc1 transposase [Trichonephila clavipes]
MPRTRHYYVERSNRLRKGFPDPRGLETTTSFGDMDRVWFPIGNHLRPSNGKVTRFDIFYPSWWCIWDNLQYVLMVDTAERLRRNVSIVHDFWVQWSRDGTASRRPGSGRPRGTTEREDHRTAVAHRTASAAEIQVAVGTTVTKELLEIGYFKYSSEPGTKQLTPSHCRLGSQ